MSWICGSSNYEIQGLYPGKSLVEITDIPKKNDSEAKTLNKDPNDKEEYVWNVNQDRSSECQLSANNA
jgi:hypothetical protein